MRNHLLSSIGVRTSLLLCALSIPASALGQNPLQDFRKAASTEAKRVVLGALIFDRSVTAGAFVAVIGEALDSRDVGVRDAALHVIGARAALARFQRDAQTREKWVSDRPILMSLRQRVEEATGDSNPETRANALFALLNLDNEKSLRPPDESADDGGVLLSDNALRLLLDRFSVEDSVAIRTEIAKTAALSQGNDGLRAMLVQRALADDTPAVVGYGLRGAAAIRLAGFEGMMYMQAIDAALAAETNEAVKKALEGLREAGQR